MRYSVQGTVRCGGVEIVRDTKRHCVEIVRKKWLHLLRSTVLTWKVVANSAPSKRKAKRTSSLRPELVGLYPLVNHVNMYTN